MSNSNQNSARFLVPPPAGAPGTSLLRARAPPSSSRSLLAPNRKKKDLPSNGKTAAGAKVRGAGVGGRSSHLMKPPLTSLLKSCRPVPRSAPDASTVMTPALLKMEKALNLQFMARNANSLITTVTDPDLSDEEPDVLLAVEAECRGCYVTKKHARTLERMKVRRRKMDLSIRFDDQGKDDQTPDNIEEEDRLVEEILKVHVKRKKLRKKADIEEEENVGKEDDSSNLSMLGLSSDYGLTVNKFTVDKTKKLTSEPDGPLTVDQLNAKRRRLWVAIAKKEIPRAHKIRQSEQKERGTICKRAAAQCMKAVRQKAMLSQKASKETLWRAKRLTREMQAYWKKFDRVEKMQKRQQEKEAEEQLKQDVQMLEAKRQQRKLNFLITQTELYAHFIQKKTKTDEQGEEAILDRLKEEETSERLAEIDDYDAEVAQEKAVRNATEAVEKLKEKTGKFFTTEDAEAILQKGLSQVSEGADQSREQPGIFRGTLKSYQLKGMNWLMDLYDQGINGILADEMGLGKTVQALSMLAYIAEKYNIWGPFLVITPASTLHNWQQEVAKFVPSFKLVPYWGSPQDRKTLRHFWDQKNLHTKNAAFHIVITSYQLVITDFKFFNRIKWQYLVLDEAQAIKSSSSQRWKMLLEFKCRNRLLLSGTPIQNTMAELWSLLHFVMPTLFDSHEEFNDWFSRDIESTAESKGRIDEKQISRLHMILKPFMLRRIKLDVENELTEKVEVLVYCPLTIRQKMLYMALKKKIRIEELLQGESISKAQSQQSNAVTSSLMNLVMQFRKVCNHPELFERREPRSPLAMKPLPYLLPKLLVRSLLNETTMAHHLYNGLSVFNANHVHRSLHHSQPNNTKKVATVRLEDPKGDEENAFSFLRFVDTSPGELEKILRSMSARVAHFAAEKIRLEKLQHRTTFELGFALSAGQLKCESKGLVFTSHTFPFVGHVDVKLCSMKETVTHRLMRTRNQKLHKDICDVVEKQDGENDEGEEKLLPPIVHVEREPVILKCQAVAAPNFLIRDLCPRVAVRDRQAYASDRGHSHRVILDALSGRDFVTMGRGREDQMERTKFDNKAFRELNGDYAGLWGCRPVHGFSNIVIPDKQTLVSDSGKLHALDGLLTRLKAGGHRVLIYSQMTKMIDLLEEFMWHRKHSFIRLDGSSKISDRRDMVADFQQRSDIFVFLLSTRAGGLGINLTAADTVIFYDSDWNPTVDQQAMDRAHRLGQTKQVTVYRLVCKGTIEERILQRAREKSEIHRMVIQGGSFKGGGKGDQLKPREVVSLLLDDEEIEQKYLAKQEMAKKRSLDSPGNKTNAKRAKTSDLEEEEEIDVVVTDSGENSMDTLLLPPLDDDSTLDSSSSRDPTRPSSPLTDFMGETLGPKRQRKRGLGGGGGRRGRPRGSKAASSGLNREANFQMRSNQMIPSSPTKRGRGRPRLKIGGGPLRGGQGPR